MNIKERDVLEAAIDFWRWKAGKDWDELSATKRGNGGFGSTGK